MVVPRGLTEGDSSIPSVVSAMTIRLRAEGECVKHSSVVGIIKVLCHVHFLSVCGKTRWDLL